MLFFECCRNKPKIDSIFASVNVDETDAPSDVTNELSELKQHWETVNKIVKDRSDALDEIIPLASQFEHSKSNVREWLKAARPRVEDLEVISVDSEKLENQEKAVKVS